MHTAVRLQHQQGKEVKVLCAPSYGHQCQNDENKDEEQKYSHSLDGCL